MTAKTEWLKLGEAAKRLGISTMALKKRRQRHQINVKPIGDGGQFVYEVPVETSDITPDEWEVLRELVTDKAPAHVEAEQTGATYRILSLFDVHVPEADAFALKAVLDFAHDEQPDHIVLGGDFLELESCSMHGGNANPLALVDEIKAGRKAISRIREACPGAALTYLEGNHETRLNRVVAAALPSFDGALTLPNLLELDAIGCEWVPYRKLWNPTIDGKRARLAYTHGEFASLHHAKKHLDTYGVSVRYGHTHRPQTTTRGFADGRVLMALGSPCLRTLAPSWAGPHNGWLHGFGWDEFFSDGKFTASNVVMADRAFAWRGKVYGQKSAS